MRTRILLACLVCGVISPVQSVEAATKVPVRLVRGSGMSFYRRAMQTQQKQAQQQLQAQQKAAAEQQAKDEAAAKEQAAKRRSVADSIRKKKEDERSAAKQRRIDNPVSPKDASKSPPASVPKAKADDSKATGDGEKQPETASSAKPDDAARKPH